jgi:hypothetical protein
LIYFDSKYLSEKIGINAAKWKRWAREFLPPDPLGGYQSGYARQFSHKDAFRVFLGGYLVSVLRLTIPEARQVLLDLDPWMKQQGLYSLSGESSGSAAREDHIYIYDLGRGRFAYTVRTITARPRADADGICTECYLLSDIGTGKDGGTETDTSHARVILIRRLHRRFLDAVGRKAGEPVCPLAHSPTGPQV